MNDLKGIIEDCNKSDLVSDRVIKKVIEIIGQEEWQILHDENNDVCTTMGELIITLKGIADVEKENAELKEKNNSLVASSKTIISLSDEIETRTMEQLTKAEEIIRTLYFIIQGRIDYEDNIQIKDSMDLARAFLNEVK